jgi:FkbH-like protein
MNPELPLSHYMLESNKIKSNNFEKQIKVAILSSFTINGLAESLKVKCFERKINSIVHVGGYNQYNQEIIDSTNELYKFSPDIAFLIIDTRSIFGDIFHYPYSISKTERQDFINNKINELLNLVNKFKENSNSKLIISNLSLPYYSPQGIAEMQTDYGFHDMIIDFNKQLKEEISKIDSVIIFDFFKFVIKHGEKNIFNFQNFLFGDIKIALDYIPYLANELMQFIISTLGISKKCIVLDLDNTLWGGIVGEDGFNGINLGPQPPGNAYVEFQKNLKALTYRGIILAINSKNNFEDAIKVIRDHPNMILRENDFACMRINWNDKSSNMKEIAKELNIGTDSLVFLDDDPLNREFIQETFPEIFTPDLPKDPSRYSELLQSFIEFSTFQVTGEDTKRKQMYLEQRDRTELKHSSNNLNDFLKKLDLKILIKKSDSFSIPRISQLTLKTNQFNLTTKRYQENDILKFSNNRNMLVGCAQIKDKFGDHGITGVFIVDKNNSKEWFLDTFLLSCRVMGREVEKAILNHIINEAQKNNVLKIKAEYIPTNKNKPIENFLRNNSFVKEGDFWVFDLNKTFNMPDFLSLSVE